MKPTRNRLSTFGAGPGTALALMTVVVVTLPRPALSFCYGPTLLNINQPTYQTIPDQPFVFNQQTSFWSVFAAMPFEPTNDGDVELYSYWSSSETQPYCLGGYITGSYNYAGRTDFIIGDFNNTALGNYYPRVYCYSGDCGADPGPQWNGAVWRPGEFLFVDFPPTTVSFGGGNPVPGDRIIKVFDVFMSSGSTYWFRFTSTMGTDAKMLLFRNTTGGTFFAPRNSAEFETSGCRGYTAPTTGYYGLVVVLDQWTTGSYTIGVTSVPSCVCADSLTATAPVFAGGVLAEERRYLTAYGNYWNAVAVRPAAGSDWDLEIGNGSGDGPACQTNVLASSTSGSGADVVVADFNHLATPGQLAVRTYRYSGVLGATLQWDTGLIYEESILQVNGPQVYEAWQPADVVKTWDVALQTGKTYTFQFYNPGGNFRVMLFRNPGNGGYYAGRTQAVVNTTADFNYTAPADDYYGLVVVKDDSNSGVFALRVGTCETPLPLTALDPVNPSTVLYYTQVAASAGTWSAVGIRSQTADWDLTQFGAASGAPWPDCYSPTGAESNGSNGIDFVIGDFHNTPAGNYHVRAKQFSSGPLTYAIMMWTGPAKVLWPNKPPSPDTLRQFHPVHAWEVWMISGVAYEMVLTQPAGGSLRAYLFENPTPGGYWAPRSARATETMGTTSYVPAVTGWHGIVVGDDFENATPYTLQVNSIPTGVGDPAPRYSTALAGAVPNPTREDLLIHYSLARPSKVAIQVVDLSGRRVADVNEGVREAGEWSVKVPRLREDGTRLSAGIYFTRMLVDGRVAATRKVSVLD